MAATATATASVEPVAVAEVAVVSVPVDVQPIYVGIDVSKAKLDVCLLPSGQTLVVSNDAANPRVQPRDVTPELRVPAARSLTSFGASPTVSMRR